MILAACVIFVIGIANILLAQTFWALLFARLWLGIAVGIVAVAVPLYLSEVAPARIRGRSVGVFQLFLTGGILLAYIVDLLFTPTGNWHAMFAIILIPTAILFFSTLRLPETPRWLLAHRHDEKAKTVLYKTRGQEEAEFEWQQIAASLKAKRGRWQDLFHKYQQGTPT